MADAALLEREIEALERAEAPRPPRWTWVLIIVGLAVAILLSAHAYAAYVTIDRQNQDAKIDTPNVVLLFQDVATNGARISPSIPTNGRNVYTRALNQYVLDGTGVCLGLALAFSGAFVRVNR